jgi:hypothetical protein
MNKLTIRNRVFFVKRKVRFFLKSINLRLLSQKLKFWESLVLQNFNHGHCVTNTVDFILKFCVPVWLNWKAAFFRADLSFRYLRLEMGKGLDAKLGMD